MTYCHLKWLFESCSFSHFMDDCWAELILSVGNWAELQTESDLCTCNGFFQSNVTRLRCVSTVVKLTLCEMQLLKPLNVNWKCSEYIEILLVIFITHDQMKQMKRWYSYGKTSCLHTFWCWLKSPSQLGVLMLQATKVVRMVVKCKPVRQTMSHCVASCFCTNVTLLTVLQNGWQE